MMQKEFLPIGYEEMSFFRFHDQRIAAPNRARDRDW